MESSVENKIQALWKLAKGALPKEFIEDCISILGYYLGEISPRVRDEMLDLATPDQRTRILEELAIAEEKMVQGAYKSDEAMERMGRLTKTWLEIIGALLLAAAL